MPHYTDKFNITTCDCLTFKLASKVWFLQRLGTVGYFDTRFNKLGSGNNI